MPDVYVGLPPVFTSVASPPGRGGTVTSLHMTYGPPPVPRDENQYWQELERRLGVTFAPTFTPVDSFGERFSVLVAGGELPDLTFLGGGGEQLEALQQGAFTDLTPYLNAEARTQFPNLACIPEASWRNAAFEGRTLGVPRPFVISANTMMFRQDWAEKLGMPRPRNADEFLELMVAMTEGDPNGNGSRDTYAMGAPNWNPFNIQFFEFMFRVPNQWRANADGTLTHASETEEFRAAVTYVRRLHEAGVYHPDAASGGAVNWKDPFSAGAIGGYTDGPGALPGINNMRARTVQVNPGANVIGLVPMGHDGGPGVTHNSAGFYGVVAIPSRVSSEERVRELLRVLDYYVAPFGSEEWRFLSYGVEGVHHDVAADGTPVLTELGQREVGGDLTYLATPPTVLYYNDRPEDAPFMQQMIRDYLAVGIDNPALGISSETAVEEGDTLGQLETDAITSIVTGRSDLSALDEFVSSWRERGGDRIREETQAGLEASS